MGGSYHYLLTSLPSLGDLGSPPPMGPAELMRIVRFSEGPIEIIELLFLGEDLRAREAILAGEREQVEPAVLTAEALRDEAPLPEYLVPAEVQSPRLVAADAVWEAYYQHVARVADQTGAGFLRDWVGFEVALRNELARRRARALNLEVEGYLVAESLADEGADLSRCLSEWSAASDPVAAARVIDRARWDWLSDHDSWFSFDADELAVYAAKLMLIVRWHALEEAAKAAEPADATA